MLVGRLNKTAFAFRPYDFLVSLRLLLREAFAVSIEHFAVQGIPV